MLYLRVVAPDLGLELDELFGDFVVGPLGQYSQDGQSRLVHVDAAAQRQPARAGALQSKGSGLQIVLRSCTHDISCFCRVPLAHQPNSKTVISRTRI